MTENTGKHCENVKIYSHFINYTGGLSPKALCDIFADLASQHSANLGFSVEKLNEMGQTWMLHRMHIKINQMPKKNETDTFETWSPKIDRLFAIRYYRIVRNNSEVLVEASSDWMMIDIARRRPIRLNPIVVDACQRCSAAPLQIESIMPNNDFDKDKVYDDSKRFTATFDNIDFNGHVTQSSYIRFITNALNFDFLTSYILTEIEIVYEHEILPDASVDSKYSIEEQGDLLYIYHKLVALSGDLTHCYAKSIWKKA